MEARNASERCLVWTWGCWCVEKDNNEETLSEMLVSGDIIHIPRHGGVVMCDAVTTDGIASGEVNKISLSVRL